MRPILVIGSTGQLGSALMRAFADLVPVGIEHRMVDIEDAGALATTFARHRPDVVINTAAFHAVDLCEVRVERAFAVNAIAVDRLAALCAAANARLVHISTDYVFDGEATTPYRETDATHPIGVYGASKLAGESLVRRHGDDYAIVRTSGLYGATGTSAKGGSFAARILAQARAGERMRVVDDTMTTPSNAAHVADAIRAIVDGGHTGTFHVTNAGACSWHDFAIELLRRSQIEATIEAVPSSTFPSLAKRPRYSVLAHDALREARLPPMPSWQEGLSEFIAQHRST